MTPRTYVIGDGEPEDRPVEVPVEALRAKRRIVLRGAVVLGVIAATVLAVRLWNHYAPARVGGQFVQAYRERDFDTLYELFDPLYRQRTSRGQNRRLLGQLYGSLPSGLTMTGWFYQIDTECVMTVVFIDPSGRLATSETPSGFGIDILRDDRAGWHVPFEASYRQLARFGPVVRQVDAEHTASNRVAPVAETTRRGGNESR